MPEADNSALTGRRLTKAYRREIRALDEVDIEISSGTTTALVGPNGAGKSTLIKIWVGFEKPTSGTARVLGRDPWAQRREAITRIGYVPQASALYRDLTVEDHLSLAASFRPRFDGAYARSLLRELDIPAGALASELSGGQVAQVVLALALGTRAEVLLLDEPLARLDPLARREFLAAVVGAARTEGTTVVMASHVITDVEHACERVAVLGHGRLLLHTDLGSLVRSHGISTSSDAGAGAVSVGSFPSELGTTEFLWRLDEGWLGTSGKLRAPTIEEVVMGYLAAGRERRRPTE